MRTVAPGVFVRKIPHSKNEPAYLALEINPIGKSGNPMNKIGVIISSRAELDAVRAIISQKDVDEVIQEIEKANQSQVEDDWKVSE